MIDTKAVRALADKLLSPFFLSQVTPSAVMLRQCADEIDALKEDAERYRWLRDAPATFIDDKGIRQWLLTRPASAQCFDEAIDRARKGTT